MSRITLFVLLALGPALVGRGDESRSVNPIAMPASEHYDVTGDRDARIHGFLHSQPFAEESLLLVRVFEWYRPEGILRFGIPRRLDGQVRMEIQLAEDFPQLRDPNWSTEDVR